MAEQASTNAPSRGKQNVFQAARELYGAAFEPKSRARVGAAMADWAELSEEERSFTLGHLLYLNLQAQASTLTVLRGIRDGIDNIDDTVLELSEALAGDEEDNDDGDFGEGDQGDRGELPGLSGTDGDNQPDADIPEFEGSIVTADGSSLSADEVPNAV